MSCIYQSISVGLLSQASLFLTLAQNGRKVSHRAFVMRIVLGLVDLLDQWSHNELVLTNNHTFHVISISLQAENQPKSRLGCNLQRVPVM